MVSTECCGTPRAFVLSVFLLLGHLIPIKIPQVFLKMLTSMMRLQLKNITIHEPLAQKKRTHSIMSTPFYIEMVKQSYTLDSISPICKYVQGGWAIGMNILNGIV